MNEEERINTIHQIAALAKHAEMIEPIDWSQLNITEDEAYLMMASNVVEQLESVPEDQRGIVSMSTMTKILVENFVLNIKLKGLRNEKNSNTL
jgi:hypothetical protein